MLAAVLLIAAAAAALAWVVARALATARRDARSLVVHRDALDRLHELCDRNAGRDLAHHDHAGHAGHDTLHAHASAPRAHVRVLTGAPPAHGRPAPPPPLRLDAPSVRFGDDDRPTTPAGAVADDGGAVARLGTAGPSGPSGNAGVPDPTATTLQPRPVVAGLRIHPPGRRPLLVVAGVAALAAVVTLAAVAPSRDGRRTAGPTAPTRPAAPATVTTRVAPGAAPVPPPGVVAVESGPGIARYAVSGVAEPTLTLTATAPCWVRARLGGPGGPTLFEGVLRAGERRSITAPALWVRLGNPGGVRATVDGTPLELPAPSGRVLTLVVAAAGPAPPAPPVAVRP